MGSRESSKPHKIGNCLNALDRLLECFQRYQDNPEDDDLKRGVVDEAKLLAAGQSFDEDCRVFEYGAIAAEAKRFLEGGDDAQPIISALERALADLPELMPVGIVAPPPDGCTWEVVVYDDDPAVMEYLKEFAGLKSVEDTFGRASLHFVDAFLKDAESVESSLALEVVSDNTDMVLLDLYWGDRFVGHKLLRLLQHRFPHLPVVVCTSDSRIETVWEFVREGASGVLHKNLDRTGRPSFEEALVRTLASGFMRRLQTPLHRPSGPRLTNATTPPPGELAVPHYHDAVLDELAQANKAPSPGQLRELLARIAPLAERVKVKRVIKKKPLVLEIVLDERPEPIVLKADRDEGLFTERLNYLRYVKGRLDNCAGRVERQPAVVFGRGGMAEPAPWCAIAYSYAHRPTGGKLRTLLELLRENPERGLKTLGSLLTDILPVWHHSSKKDPTAIDLAELTARHIGPLLRVSNPLFGPVEDAALWGEVSKVDQSVQVNEMFVTGFDLRVEGWNEELLDFQKLPVRRNYLVRVNLKGKDKVALRGLHPWLHVGRQLGLRDFGVAAVPGSKRLDGLAPVFHRFEKGGNGQGVLAPRTIIHGDLNLGNVLAQEDRPDYPWIIDFRWTCVGNPLWDLVKLETEIVQKVMIDCIHRWDNSSEDWAEAMVRGDVSGFAGLSWFHEARDKLHTACRIAYKAHGLSSSAELHRTALHAVFAAGATKWKWKRAGTSGEDQLAHKMKQAYAAACFREFEKEYKHASR